MPDENTRQSILYGHPPGCADNEGMDDRIGESDSENSESDQEYSAFEESVVDSDDNMSLTSLD